MDRMRARAIATDERSLIIVALLEAADARRRSCREAGADASPNVLKSAGAMDDLVRAIEAREVLL